MRNIKLVFNFTFKDAIRRKSFIITTAIISVIIIGLSVVPRLLADNKAKNQTEPPTASTEIKDEDKTRTFYFTDADNVVPNIKAALDVADPYTRFIQIEPSDLAAHKEKVSSTDKIFLMEIIKADPQPKIKYYFDNFISAPSTEIITESVRQQFLMARFSENSVDNNLATLALTPMVTEAEGVGSAGSVAGYLLGTVLLIVMFISIYYYGYGVASSIASEKTSRIMETLVVSAKPSHILMGKAWAMGCVGLLQVTAILTVTILATNIILPGGFEIGGMPLDFSALNIPTLLLVLLYFVLGYALYAMLNAVCGATVSRTEDLQTAIMPVAVLSMIAYYLSLGNLFTANSTMSAATSYIPFVTPFRMAFRLMNESVPVSDILISLLILIVSVVLVAFFAIRLYSASVLHYGERLKLKNLIKMAK